MELRPLEPDRTAFRSAMGQFASSVTVITMRDEKGCPLGMTATAFCSVSDDPLLVLICVNRTARTYAHIARRGQFGVNILRSTARAVSDHCSRSGLDKDLPTEWLVDHDEWGSPALVDALAFVDCDVDSDREAGTHAILVGRVRGIGLATHGDPLLYFAGRYKHARAEVQYRRPDPLPVLSEDGGDWFTRLGAPPS